MINETSYALGANRSAIRDLFEYGKMRAAIVGAENVLDFSFHREYVVKFCCKSIKFISIGKADGYKILAVYL